MTYRRVFTQAVKSYQQASHTVFSGRYLFYTNVLLSMSISAAGDLIEQNYELHTKEIDKIDLNRTKQMCLTGFTSGILCHNWYIFLDKAITGRSVKMVAKKLLLDQFICSPIIILSFFATIALLEENPLENFTDEVADKFLTLYKAEWVVWPPAQIINFYFLPTRFRVLYDNIISLGYDIYTSQIKNAKKYKTMEDKSDTN